MSSTLPDLPTKKGRIVKTGTRDPAEDVEFIRREIILWVKSLLDKDWPKITRAVESGAANPVKLPAALMDKLSGLSIDEEAIEVAIHKRGLKIDKPSGWSDSDLYGFCETLLEISKPILIAANKCDLPTAKETIDRLSGELSESIIVPCAAEAELLLRRASQANLISYLPGDASFQIKDESKISSAQRKALDLVKTHVLDVWHGTGVQNAINDAYLRLLKGIVVYPVEDETKYSDKKGNVLPDARIMHQGDTARDLAFKVHTDLGKRIPLCDRCENRPPSRGRLRAEEQRRFEDSFFCQKGLGSGRDRLFDLFVHFREIFVLFFNCRRWDIGHSVSGFDQFDLANPEVPDFCDLLRVVV